MSGHTAQVAALLQVLESVAAELEQRRRPLKRASRETLELLRRWVAGEAVTLAQLDAATGAAHESGVLFPAREKDRAVSHLNTAVGNTSWIAQQLRGWKEAVAGTLDSASYALSSLGVAGVRDIDALNAQFAAALKAPPPMARPPRPPRAKTRPVELSAFIGPVAQSWFQRGRARCLEVAAPAGGPAAVQKFLERYGSIQMEGWVFGAGETQGALTTVIEADNDVIYLLDAHGKAWAQDTIEDPRPVPFATDATRMVARLALTQLAWGWKAKRELPGRQGRATAKTLGLPAIAAGTDRLGAAWGDATALVLEAVEGKTWTTRVAAPTARRLAKLPRSRT